MVETKVRLSLCVPGAQLLSEQECSKNPKDNYNTEIVTVSYKAKKGKFHRDRFTIRTRKQRLVRQAMNISKEAFNYMTSASEVPAERNYRNRWKNMSIKERLAYHFDKIASDLKAVSYTYEIFED